VHCKTCHYSLTGLTGPPHRCPECGNPFDPNDPSTFDVLHRKKPRWIRFVVIAVLTYIVLFVFMAHETFTRPAPQIINNIPGAQATYAPPTIASSLLRVALRALGVWPSAFVLVLLVYCLLSLMSQVRSAIAALSAALR
jgi:hypothetical protein